MLDPLDFQNRPLVEKLERKRRIAALVLLLERVTLCVWRPALWAMLFFSLWMLQIPLILGTVASIACAAAFFGGLLYLLYTDVRHLRLPDAQEINRRIETDSDIPHRPISSLKDNLANPSKAETRSLWVRGREHILKVLPLLRVGPPQALLASRDPRAVRLGIFLFFIVGLLTAGSHWNERIANGMVPFKFENGAGVRHDIEIWITPPEYTSIPQTILNEPGGNGKELAIPSGSKLKVLVHAGFGQPHVQVGTQTWKLENSGDDNYALEMDMPEGQRLEVKQLFFTRAAFNYKISPDHEPVIVLKGDPQPMPDGPLRFPLMVYDDYGVKNLIMEMTLDPASQKTPLGEPITESRAVMSPPSTELEMSPVYDLTDHPWAGQVVLFTFTAEDHQGHRTSTAPLQMKLPERIFQHPVAKALIEIRRKLVWDPLDSYGELSFMLESLLQFPSAFHDDFLVFLSLRSAASRLYYADPPSLEISSSLVDLLWDIALHVEDGNLSLAARNLHDAQTELEKALQNPNATDAQIANLMQQLRQSMAEYFTELQREIHKRTAKGESMPMLSPELLSNVMNPEMLAGFLEELEARMAAGDRTTAQEMLSQLQRMMDSINPSMAMSLPPDMQMMNEGINELQELIERQEQLLEQTRKQIESYQALKNIPKDFGENLPIDKNRLKEWGLNELPPVPAPGAADAPSINTQDNSKEQEALRYMLGQLMLKAGEALNEVPENMGKAEREMNSSAEALKTNRPDISIPHQDLALQYLKESQQQMSQQLASRLQQMSGMMMSNGGMRYDPLGRPYGGQDQENGMFPGSRVKIPDESERKKAQEILRLLRRRSGELDRPDVELDYYRRLLKQF